MSAERDVAPYTLIERSGVERALSAVSELAALCASLNDSRARRSASRLIESLRVTLARRLSGEGARLSASTRLALWERLWIELELYTAPNIAPNTAHNTAHNTAPADLTIWRAVSDASAAIARISAALRDDPQWSPASVRAQRDALSAEYTLAWLISHHARFEGLSASLAPLDADILQGLDISLKRARPRARGWAQLSLSAEPEINARKERRLKRSAACVLISPHTILRHLDHVYTPDQRARWWSAVGAAHPPRQATARARLIGQRLKSALSLTAHRARATASSPDVALKALCEVLADLLNAALGKPAARSYRHRDQLPDADPDWLNTVSQEC